MVNYYRCKDIYLGAYLLTQGAKLEKIDHPPYGKSWIVFSHPEIEDLVRSYFNNVELLQGSIN